jgi:hypothetical protein
MTTCAVDWPAFSLANPDGYTGCAGEAIVTISQACVHEHIASSDACYACLAEMLSYEPEPSDWQCGPCAAAGCQCPAPLAITELTPGATP